MMIAKYKCVVLLLLCTMCGIYLPCPKGSLSKLNFVWNIHGLIIRQLPIISDGLLIWLIMGDQWSLIMVNNMVYHGWQSDKFQSSQMLHTATLGLHHKLIPSDYRGGEVYFFPWNLYIDLLYMFIYYLYSNSGENPLCGLNLLGLLPGHWGLFWNLRCDLCFECW